MPFDWCDYLELARALVDLRGSSYSQEATQRSAVSRAYFAAFCSARNYAVNNLGYKPERGANDHAELRKHLQKQRYPELASRLNKLRQWRNACDYDNNVSQLCEMVRDSLRVAEKIIHKCR